MRQRSHEQAPFFPALGRKGSSRNPVLLPSSCHRSGGMGTREHPAHSCVPQDPADKETRVAECKLFFLYRYGAGILWLPSLIDHRSLAAQEPQLLQKDGILDDE